MATNFVVFHLLYVIQALNLKIKIDSLTNFLDIFNLVNFPSNLMTKYGHESGSIAISQKIIQIHMFST